MGRGTRHYEKNLPHEDIIKLHNNGIGVLSIAVRLGVRAALIRNYLAEGPKAKEYREHGVTAERLAKILNISIAGAEAFLNQKYIKDFYVEKEASGLPDHMI